jgi:hypothetical protein
MTPEAGTWIEAVVRELPAPSPRCCGIRIRRGYARARA